MPHLAARAAKAPALAGDPTDILNRARQVRLRRRRQPPVIEAQIIRRVHRINPVVRGKPTHPAGRADLTRGWKHISALGKPKLVRRGRVRILEPEEIRIVVKNGPIPYITQDRLGRPCHANG